MESNRVTHHRAGAGLVGLRKGLRGGVFHRRVPVRIIRVGTVVGAMGCAGVRRVAVRGGVDVGGGAEVGSGCHRGLGVSAQRLGDGARGDGDVGCRGGGRGLESGDLG